MRVSFYSGDLVSPEQRAVVRRSSCAVPERSPPGESDPREPPAESRERPGSARLGEEDGSEAEKTEEEEELPKSPPIGSHGSR